tara:strand:+ start:120 stop:644 length:525 start_codon:yes stop_codon:yes gene_type:complete
MMEYIISHLDFILPAVLVMILSVYMLNKVLNHDHSRRVFEYKKSVAKEMVTLRMQAYERLALFLERMQPSNLLLRVHKPNMKSSTLHAVLLKTIRSEFDHNMSQQVYVSDSVWKLINQAKDQLIVTINQNVTSVSPESDATELRNLIIEASLEEQNWLVDKALSLLKEELRKNY